MKKKIVKQSGLVELVSLVIKFVFYYVLAYILLTALMICLLVSVALLVLKAFGVI
jgi:hypothetical protein